MKPILIAMLMWAVLLVAIPAGAGDGDADHAAGAAVDDPRFEFLKRLEGIWVATGPGEAAGTTFEWRVTAGGTAVEEREMIGTPMEMVTVYHMEGRDLVATHYCMLGNQPHLTAARKLVDDSLTFACNGTPGNAASHDDKHVHGWTLRLDDDGRLSYSAELVEQDRPAEAPSMVLTRQQPAASR